MRLPVTHRLRRARIFFKTTAVAVIVAFLGLYLQPLAIAAHLPKHKSTSSVTRKATDEEKLANTLEKIEKRLERLEAKLAKAQDASLEKSDLKKLHKQLIALDKKAMANFRKIEQHLKDKKLPQVILDRHNEAVATYKTELRTLRDNLDAVETATTDDQRRAKAYKAKERLKSKQKKRKRQPFDPNQLPVKSLQPDPDNKPKKSKEAFRQAGLFDHPYVKVATHGNFTFDQLPGADDPAFLAETVEVRLSDAVKVKALELEHDPVKIYHWVRNNIEWLPTWGAMQDADLTLSAERGNAFDISSLLIALLRASDIPARYVHGTIEVPTEQFKNWAGGFSDVTAASDFAASGGIPTTNVISAGQIARVQIEHIWVEAAIDFQPSRGAVNKAADNWVQIDPSFKQYEFVDGLDAATISGVDPEQVTQSFSDSGTINQQESFINALDPQILESAQDTTETALEQHIANNLPGGTVGDVIGGRQTIVQEFPVLPSGLPYNVLLEGARFGEIPDQLQNQVTFAFATDIFGNLVDALSFPWPRLNNQKVTLSFTPASEADQQTLLSLVPEGEITDISQLPTSIPAYLVNVIPDLRINGEIAKQGSSMRLGEELPFAFSVTMPTHGTQVHLSPVIAGSYLSVAVVGGNVSLDLLREAQSRADNLIAILGSNDQTLIASLTKEDLIGDLFYAGTLGYFAQYIALNNNSGLTKGVRHILAPSLGTYGYEPEVDTFFGFPRAIEQGGAAMDIDRVVRVIGTTTGDPTLERQFNVQSGVVSSALEHAVPEQMFVTADNPGEAISAVKALVKANSQGQRIYHLTPANQTQTLPNINHTSLVMDEIRASLAVGKEVITHTDAVSVPGFTGAGYIILDPETGDGAYKIGGRNGGFIFTLLITIIAFIVGFFILVNSSLLIGGIILVWEGINFFLWIDAIESADSDEEFNQANFSQFVVSLLGLLPVILNVPEAVAVLWFGILFTFLLTSAT